MRLTTVYKVWLPSILLLALAGCHSERVSTRQLSRSHYVLPPPATAADLSPQQRLVLDAEWPAPYTVMRPEDEDVVRVRQDRWVPCDDYGRSFRLVTSQCEDYGYGNTTGIVRVRSSYGQRALPPCDRVISSNRRQPCQGRARVGGYGAPVVVNVPQYQRRVGPRQVIVISPQ